LDDFVPASIVVIEAQICDVWGDPIGNGSIIHTSEGGGCEVLEPLNDSRTARCVLSAYDGLARKIRPLDRVLAVTYGPYLIFKGVILSVRKDFAAGHVEVAAHDPSIKLKHHYFQYGDAAVEVGYPLDGIGMRRLIEASLPSGGEIDRNFPPNGILWGYDNTTRQGPRPIDPKNPQPGAGIWRRVRRHENVWQSVQNLAALDEVGPDFRLRPVDRDHPGRMGGWAPGFFTELDTNDRLGIDKFDEIIFEHGTGNDNAENVTHEPDGSVVRNWFGYAYPGGQRDKQDSERLAISRNWGSIDDYGLMQGLESSGQTGDVKSVLQKKAREWVKAYGRPPDFFQVVPRIDSADNVPQYSGGLDTFGHNYRVGDTIRARADNGYMDVDLIGRITLAEIRSVDQAGNVKVTLTCVPTIDPPDAT
jgi:hypothetical protein